MFSELCKNCRGLIVHITHLHGKCERHPRFLSRDNLLTRFPEFDLRWPLTFPNTIHCYKYGASTRKIYQLSMLPDSRLKRSCYCAKSQKHRHTHTHMPLQMDRLLFEEKRPKESTREPFRYVQRTFAGKRHLTPASLRPPFHKKLGRQPHYTWNYYLGKHSYCRCSYYAIPWTAHKQATAQTPS